MLNIIQTNKSNNPLKGHTVSIFFSINRGLRQLKILMKD